MQRTSGFSLVELMIAIAVLGILTAIAAPAMSNFVTRQRVSSQANELMLTFAFARSEAVKLNTSIVVIPATNSPTGWQDGWCVGPVSINNCSDAAVIRRFPGSEGVDITTNYLATGAPKLSFLRDGTVCTACRDVPVSVTSSKLEGSGLDARCISINGQGRTSVKKVARNASC